MAVATVGRRKKQREAADAAARQRRSRMMLIGLSVILLIVAVIEVPKTLSKVHSSSTAAESTAVSSAASAARSEAASAAAVRAKLALIDRQFPAKDPFVVQLGQSSATVAKLQPFATAPSVKASHFVSKDPFKAQVGLAAGEAVAAVPAVATGPSVTPAKSSGVTTKAPTSGYIVVLRSLDSKGEGLSELRRAHANGFPSAELLFSSKYTTLRRGYWVVYVRYQTAQGANSGTQRAHGQGYPSAYRRIAKP
jgi:hypothetical protein